MPCFFEIKKNECMQSLLHLVWTFSKYLSRKCTYVTNMSSIKTEPAWQIARCLFNGVALRRDMARRPHFAVVSVNAALLNPDSHAQRRSNICSFGNTHQLSVAICHHFFQLTNRIVRPRRTPGQQWRNYVGFFSFSPVVTLESPSRRSAVGVVIITQRISQFPRQLWSSRMEIWRAGKC